MKKFLFFGLAVIGIAILTIVNINLNVSSNVTNVSLKNSEALTTSECPPPDNGAELLNGCKSNEGVSDLNNEGTGTMAFSCSSDQDVTCTYGTLQVVKHMVQSGQVLSTYTCRTIIVL
jgi:hypothetical protein